MVSYCEGEEVFFDSVDDLMCEESVIAKDDWMCRDSDYDVWLSEPVSVRERREIFISRMGFPECLTFVESEFERNSESRGAVSSCCSWTSASDDDLLSERLKSNSEANCSGGDYVEGEISEDHVSSKKCERKEEELEDCVGIINRKKMSWWRHLTRKMKKNLFKLSKSHGGEAGKLSRVRIEQNRKRYMECSAVYAGQQLKAHNGLIWTMKFSPDGQYLASGGGDGVVCVWRVASVYASCQAGDKLDMEGKKKQKKKIIQASVVVPENIFHIEEEPLHKFQGHSADVLDIAWSTSNHLLSSSMDKTIRLWQAGSDECLGVFHHSNYVTCVQFNPVDENYFISGSIDGKVRIWGIARRRVKDWANVPEIVTAVCYQPHGKGFVVGSVSGSCRFYEISGDDDELLLNANINIQGKRKSCGNRITGIQFLKKGSQRMMVTSEDSKIRILDGLEVVHKYKGLTNSGCQMSASFTSSGRHIVSVGEDSRIYLWDHDDVSTIQTSKQAKSTRSCENFFSEGVSVAIPWSDSDIGNNCCNSHDDHREASSRIWDSERFSLANWFSMDGSSRASTTWPEEKLPLCEYPSADHDDCQPCNAAAPAACGDHLHHKNERHGSTTWGLVFVTANWDGTIRTFHNYGFFPARI